MRRSLAASLTVSKIGAGCESFDLGVVLSFVIISSSPLQSLLIENVISDIYDENFLSSHQVSPHNQLQPTLRICMAPVSLISFDVIQEITEGHVIIFHVCERDL
jgi:hypothetical protein